MELSLGDWRFQLDVEKTREHTLACSLDHCTCAYCRNYYENVSHSYPTLGPVLAGFGVELSGPSELMPLEPTLYMVCYRVSGKILHRGDVHLFAEEVCIRPEEADESSFFLWIGELELPWTQPEAMEAVVSPANEPGFLEKMYRRWLATRFEQPFAQ